MRETKEMGLNDKIGDQTKKGGRFFERNQAKRETKADNALSFDSNFV